MFVLRTGGPRENLHEQKRFFWQERDDVRKHLGTWDMNCFRSRAERVVASADEVITATGNHLTSYSGLSMSEYDMSTLPSGSAIRGRRWMGLPGDVVWTSKDCRNQFVGYVRLNGHERAARCQRETGVTNPGRP